MGKHICDSTLIQRKVSTSFSARELCQLLSDTVLPKDFVIDDRTSIKLETSLDGMSRTIYRFTLTNESLTQQ